MKRLMYVLLSAVLFLTATVVRAESAHDAAGAQLPADKAGVFIYRNTGMMGKTLVREVWLDGQSLGELPNSSFFYVEVTPGSHVLSAQAAASESDLRFTAKAGSRYYFSQTFVRKVPVVGAVPLLGSVVGAFASNVKYEQAGEEDGVANLADCTQLAVKNLAVTGTVQQDCVTALESDPELKPISSKVALSGKEDNLFSLMTIEEQPNKNERKLIAKWGAKREACFNANPPPRDAYYQLSVDTFNRGQQLILELSKGQMSYGQFAERRKAIKQESIAQAKEIKAQ